MNKLLQSDKVTTEVECIGPSGQDYRIKTFKLDNVYYLETSQVYTSGKRDGYKSQWVNTKGELIKLRCLAYSYLYDKGIW
jgi:hypothetical protein